MLKSLLSKSIINTFINQYCVSIIWRILIFVYLRWHDPQGGLPKDARGARPQGGWGWFDPLHSLLGQIVRQGISAIFRTTFKTHTQKNSKFVSKFLTFKQLKIIHLLVLTKYVAIKVHQSCNQSTQLSSNQSTYWSSTFCTTIMKCLISILYLDNIKN